MISAYVRLIELATALVEPLTRRTRHDQRGQASAEYALVLLGAAAIALLVLGWATKTDLIEKLFDAVMNSITGNV